MTTGQFWYTWSYGTKPSDPQVTWMDGRDRAPLHLPNGSTHWVDVDPRPKVGFRCS